ncbi:hypothetical protein ABZX12_26675 [Kribbella sp. NPDC003505]|uniref:hypothetical protein n=1 Tax=Kribbella sp. NPDC003505 TaxID=3154448 RepID=UPI0033A95CF3
MTTRAPSAAPSSEAVRFDAHGVAPIPPEARDSDGASSVSKLITQDKVSAPPSGHPTGGTSVLSR